MLLIDDNFMDENTKVLFYKLYFIQMTSIEGHNNVNF
jgi:hypothetical protein